MIVPLVFVFIATIGCGSIADATMYKSYTMQQVALTPEIRAEFQKLNRYCGSRYPSYSYYSAPATSGFNLASLLGPAIFGLAAVGGLLAASSLLNGGATSVTVGK